MASRDGGRDRDRSMERERPRDLDRDRDRDRDRERDRDRRDNRDRDYQRDRHDRDRDRDREPRRDERPREDRREERPRDDRPRDDRPRDTRAPVRTERDDRDKRRRSRTPEPERRVKPITSINGEFRLSDLVKVDGAVNQLVAEGDVVPASSLPGSQAPAKKAPVSIEELMKKREEAEALANKPKFMSKAERERIRKEEEEKAAAEKKKAEEAPVATVSNYDRRRREDREREVERESRHLMRQEREKEKELQVIKDQYLGGDKNLKKKKIVKPSEKFKYVFDWEASEDTSRDPLAILGTGKDEPALLFGRGRIGGIDDRNPKASIYDQIVKLRTGADVVRTQKDEFGDSRKTEKHWTEKTLAEMTVRDWRIVREDFNIVTKGGNVPNPMRNWKESGLPQILIDTIDKIGYKKPTPIQMAAIPVGMASRDIIGVASTGSGKTAAFVLPMLQYISRLPKMTQFSATDGMKLETVIDGLTVVGPYALILAPTRELALQIEIETNKFCAALGYRAISVIGGVSIEQQSISLREGAEIIIATPGRLKDSLDARYLVLNQCNYVVMDEADRMIDMGFEDQVNEILSAMPSSNLRPEDETLEEADVVYRQTIMFSATMPPELEKLAKTYMRRPAIVSIGDLSSQKYVDTIEQRVELVPEAGKKNRLLQLLDQGPTPVIVFVNQKKGADMLGKTLDKLGYKAVALHGGKQQDMREAAVEAFKSGRYNILVATDVAGRGLDIKGIKHVINYDMPAKIEDYQHRIGRTGRAGENGLATSLVCPASDTEIMYDLKNYLRLSQQTVPKEFDQHEASQTKPGAYGAPKLSKKDDVMGGER